MKLSWTHPCYDDVRNGIIENPKKKYTRKMLDELLVDIFPNLPSEKREELQARGEEGKSNWFRLTFYDMRIKIAKGKAKEELRFPSNSGHKKGCVDEYKTEGSKDSDDAAFVNNEAMRKALQLLDDGKPKVRRKKRIAMTVRRDDPMLEPLRTWMNTGDNQVSAFGGTERDQVIRDCIALAVPEVKSCLSSLEPTELRAYFAKKMQHNRPGVLRPQCGPNRVNRRPVGAPNTSAKENVNSRNKENRAAVREMRVKVDLMIWGADSRFAGKSVKEVVNMMSMHRLVNDEKSRTIDEICRESDTFIHFNFTFQDSNANEECRSLVHDNNPMFIWTASGRPLNRKEFLEYCNWENIICCHDTTGVRLRAIEGGFQTKYDRRELGKKGWRRVDSGSKYTAVPGLFRINFLWSTTLVQLVKEGLLKVMPTKRNAIYGIPPNSNVFTG